MRISVLACGPGGARAAACLLVLSIVCAACGGSEPLPVPKATDRGDGDSGGDGDGDATDGGMMGRFETTPVPFSFDPPDAAIATCDCGVNGECGTDDEGNPACECVKGYIANDPLGPCIEDRNCVELTPLTCRAVWGGNVGAGNGILLSASYCSGRPYEDVMDDELSIEFKAPANPEFQVLKPDESLARVIPRDTIPHLYFAIDISNSIKDEDLVAVASHIQQLFDRLQTPDNRLRVSIFLFDGSWYLYEYVPETTDLDAVRAQLDQLHLQQGVDTVSTNLRGAVRSTVHRIERSFALKSLSSRFGVLNTGTVVVISDGNDLAGYFSQSEVEAQIATTKVKVITIRIGNEERFDQLAALGRDGAFNANTPELLATTFDTIGDRIEAFEASLTFVGYCAPTRDGLATTRLSLKSLPGTYAECTFNASVNQIGCGEDVLDPSSQKGCFLPGGVVRRCGGLLACGMCPEGQCCNGGLCEDATIRTSGQHCATERDCEDSLTCTGAAGMKACEGSDAVLGDTCMANGICNPGVLACEETEFGSGVHECFGARPLEWSCDRAEDCASLSCAPPRPSTMGPRMCLPVARMFERCDNAAVCEPGSFCSKASKACDPQRFSGNPCDADEQCRSGWCIDRLCAYSPQCSYGFNLDIGPELHTLQP